MQKRSIVRTIVLPSSLLLLALAFDMGATATRARAVADVERTLTVFGSVRVRVSDDCPQAEVNIAEVMNTTDKSHFVINWTGPACDKAWADIHLVGDMNPDATVHIKGQLATRWIQCSTGIFPGCAPEYQVTREIDDTRSLAEFPLSLETGPSGLGEHDLESDVMILESF